MLCPGWSQLAQTCLGQQHQASCLLWLGGQHRAHSAPTIPLWLGCENIELCGCGFGHPTDLKAENYSHSILFTGRVVGLRVLSMLKIFADLFGSSPALFCLTFSATANHSEILYISSWSTLSFRNLNIELSLCKILLHIENSHTVGQAGWCSLFHWCARRAQRPPQHIWGIASNRGILERKD